MGGTDLQSISKTLTNLYPANISKWRVWIVWNFIAKIQLHMQNRFKGCMFQCTTTQGLSKINKISLGRKLVRVPLPLFWTVPSTKNFVKWSKVPISVLRCLMIWVFLDDLLIFLLQHLGSVINFKKCVLEFLGMIVNSKPMVLSLPSGSVSKCTKCKR